MKRLVQLFLILILSGAGTATIAQDTLPKFSVRNIGANRIIIGWVNPFQDVRQISIQRSHDSLKNYKTILSVTDPAALQNGFADTKAPNDHMYYRLFYVIGGGSFFFTEAKQPVLDTANKAISLVSAGNGLSTDSAIKNNVILKNPAFVPSFYVYTNKEGSIFINLPDYDKKDYSLKFYEENGTFLFDIKNIKEPALTLDKANFHHAGWFHFELFNDEKLVEKHKFYISKMF